MIPLELQKELKFASAAANLFVHSRIISLRNDGSGKDEINMINEVLILDKFAKECGLMNHSFGFSMFSFRPACDCCPRPIDGMPIMRSSGMYKCSAGTAERSSHIQMRDKKIWKLGITVCYDENKEINAELSHREYLLHDKLENLKPIVKKEILLAEMTEIIEK